MEFTSELLCFFTFSLACECSTEAKKKSWKYFGIHHYGVCFGGAEFSPTTAERANDCFDPSFSPCSGDAPECTGTGKSIYVFNTGNSFDTG